MNYIKKIEGDEKVQSAKICGLMSGLLDLRAYLTSDKFAIDTTVQTFDVLNRIDAAIKLANDLAFDQVLVNIQAERERSHVCPVCRIRWTAEEGCACRNSKAVRS